MLINYKQLALINFPIFSLSGDNVHVQDGILWYENLVVDDRNQIGDTLGARRLQTPHPLYRLRHCYEGIPELLKSKKKYFVDNKGYFFIYERTKFCKVITHKILRVADKETFTVLKLDKIPYPVTLKRPPPSGMTWISMLYLDGRPWLPYAYNYEHCKPTKRKI